MKKTLLVLVVLSLFAAFSFGQAADDPLASPGVEQKATTTQRIEPEDQHLEDKNARVWFEYNEAYGEARVYYETLYVTYDRAQAMNTVMRCLQDFTTDHQYYHYRYLRDDREKFFKDDKGQRKAQYMSYVKFDR